LGNFKVSNIVLLIRKISQFDNKFLLVLWNKQMSRTEMFFDTAQKLRQNFQNSSNKTFKTLNTDENFLIAINEPKGLIAIFNTEKVVVSFRNFFIICAKSSKCC
jgi:hypothetical protein